VTKCENNVGIQVPVQKLDSALFLKGTMMAEGPIEGEKELSRRVAAPQDINESNKFRSLLKLKFDLRPTDDYRRAKLLLSRRLAR